MLVRTRVWSDKHVYVEQCLVMDTYMMQYQVSCVQAFDNEVYGEDRRLPITLSLAALAASTTVCIWKLL